MISRQLLLWPQFTNSVEPGAAPRVSLEKLQESIPEFEWAKGHSGVLLPEEMVAKLDELCEED